MFCMFYAFRMSDVFIVCYIKKPACPLWVSNRLPLLSSFMPPLKLILYFAELYLANNGLMVSWDAGLLVGEHACIEIVAKHSVYSRFRPRLALPGNDTVNV